MLTCVGWKVTLCDPIWQETLRYSCEISINSYTYLHLYLGPISHRFGDIAGFFVPQSDPITPIQPQFREVFSSPQMAHVVGPPHTGLKLFGREIIFQEFQPM